MTNFDGAWAQKWAQSIPCSVGRYEPVEVFALADRTAGRFDDIVLGLPDKTVAYQVKTSRDPEAFSLRTLLFGSESLLETMLDSRARLTNQELSKSFTPVTITRSLEKQQEFRIHHSFVAA